MNRFLSVFYIVVLVILFGASMLISNPISDILLFVWFAFMLINARKIRDGLLQEKQLRVKVYAKGNAIGSKATNSTYECNLSFRLPDGAVWTFPVSPELYNTVSEGDEGTLVYRQLSPNRQAYFVRFERDED